MTLDTSAHRIMSLTAFSALIIFPILLSRREVHESRSARSRLGTVKWRVMGSIMQSASIFTISYTVFAVTHFTSPLGFEVAHHIFPQVVVRLGPQSGAKL